MNSDILIIGGGVAGLSAAAALSPHAKVRVLEAEEQTGFHSSGRSAALLHYALGNPPVRRLTQASRAFFEDPPEGFGALSSRLPILTPARESEFAQLEALADDLTPFTEIEWLDADGLRAECPVLRIGAGEAERGIHRPHRAQARRACIAARLRAPAAGEWRGGARQLPGRFHRAPRQRLAG